MPTMDKKKKAIGIKDIRGGLDQFQTLLKVHEGLSVAFFWAEWADQCSPLNDAMKLLSKDKNLASVQFLRVDFDKHPSIPNEYDVEAVPNFLLFSPGGDTVIDQVEGTNLPHIVKTIKDSASVISSDQERRALKGLISSPKSNAAEEEKGLELLQNLSLEEHHAKEKSKVSDEKAETTRLQPQQVPYRGATSVRFADLTDDSFEHHRSRGAAANNNNSSSSSSSTNLAVQAAATTTRRKSCLAHIPYHSKKS